MPGWYARASLAASLRSLRLLLRSPNEPPARRGVPPVIDQAPPGQYPLREPPSGAYPEGPASQSQENKKVRDGINAEIASAARTEQHLAETAVATFMRSTVPPPVGSFCKNAQQSPGPMPKAA